MIREYYSCQTHITYSAEVRPHMKRPASSRTFDGKKFTLQQYGDSKRFLQRGIDDHKAKRKCQTRMVKIPGGYAWYARGL